VEKTKEVYILPKLTNCFFSIASFDMWMSKGVHDIFAFVINLLGSDWQPKQVTIDFFEATKITGQKLVNNLTNFFDQYGFKNNIIAYVKDEGSNLNTMTIVLKYVVKYEVFGLYENFQGSCFGHVFSKACQYANTNEKVCRNLKFVSIKFAQSHLQKCITWLKFFGKGGQEINKACSKSNFLPRKLNTLMKTR